MRQTIAHRSNISIRDKNVGPAIIVEIGKASAPRNKLMIWPSEPRRKGIIRKPSIEALILVKAHRLISIPRHDNVQRPIAIVVREVRHHVPHGSPLRT